MVYTPHQVWRFFGTLTTVCFLAVAAAVPRIVMLFTVERYMDADECVVGIMAKHISEGRAHPLFFYGQHYGGGHAIEAWLAAPFFRWFGPSDITIQAVPLLFSIGVVLLVFFIVRRLAGMGAGALSALILSFSTPFLKSSLKADGYIETIFFCLAALAVALRSGDDDKEKARPIRDILLIGFLLGVAVWCYDFAIIYVLAISVYLARRSRLTNLGSWILYAAAFALGAAALVWDNLTQNFAHVRHLLYGRPYPTAFVTHFFQSLWNLVSHDFPAFLSKDCVHNFTPGVTQSSWVYYAAILVAAAVVIWKRRLPGPFLWVPAIYTVFYAVSSFAGVSPRYLLPYEPFASIALGVAVVELLRNKAIASRIAALVLAGAVVWVTTTGVSAVMTDYSLIEGNIPTNPKELVRVVDYLENHDIRCVYTTYFIKWRLLFESRERITALDILAYRKTEGYLRYEQAGCPPKSRSAFVFHVLSPYLVMVRPHGAGEGPYRAVRIGEHIILYSEKPEKPPLAFPSGAAQ